MAQSTVRSPRTFLLLSILISGMARTAAAEFGPPPPQNPGTAANGLATQHGDSAASDTTPLSGPGEQAVVALQISLGAVCPSILVGADDYPVAICTKIANQTPSVFLLDPHTGLPLATMELAKGDLPTDPRRFAGCCRHLPLRDGRSQQRERHLAAAHRRRRASRHVAARWHAGPRSCLLSGHRRRAGSDQRRTLSIVA